MEGRNASTAADARSRRATGAPLAQISPPPRPEVITGVPIFSQRLIDDCKQSETEVTVRWQRGVPANRRTHFRTTKLRLGGLHSKLQSLTFLLFVLP